MQSNCWEWRQRNHRKNPLRFLFVSLLIVSGHFWVSSRAKKLDIAWKTFSKDCLLTKTEKKRANDFWPQTIVRIFQLSPKLRAWKIVRKLFDCTNCKLYQEPYLIFWRSVVTSYGNLTLSKEEAEEMILSGMLIHTGLPIHHFVDLVRFPKKPVYKDNY